jgi:hypothetical protein
MRRKMLLAAAVSSVVFFPSSAFADSTGANASPAGECIGIASANWASTQKSNSTGLGVSWQATNGVRSYFVNTVYRSVC